MKMRIPGISVAAVGLLLAASAVPAQEPATHTETTTKHTGAGPNTKTKTEWVTGTVKSYDAGKSIKIEGPGGKDYSFDLDKDAHVKGSIAVGQKAKVGYTKDADGKEHVTVLSSGGAATSDTGKQPMSKHSHNMAATSDETQAANAGPRMHSESTVKHTGPGPDTKTSNEVVVGTVKKYEAGKKIEVTGPGNKDYTFDLDHAAGVEGNVAVGERVKVTYTKTNDGNKVTTVQPAHGGK
jgi:ABC-type glycerol-3-phosphate transport system substrate-binding protein